MKKRFLTVATVSILAGSFMFSSCIGSFGLSNKVLAWNQTIDSKFVNEVVFFALWIVPVYEITMLADLLVLNSIEFWSGDNPVQAGVVKTVQGENGIYTVETLQNGYHIENEEGKDMELIYDKATNTWSVVAAGETNKLITIEDKDNALVYLPDGKTQRVELSQAGVLAMQKIAQSYNMAAR
ncbi:hypothetical protein M2132_000431 [Dysgonomonas sp. PH5-45]|uniref:DUF3332 domain-containing protein n=1 Tax=unclassified Dysgonomonas TaxID=2630389 RepID=UPI0024754CCA|nr:MULTISPECIES: DUF3332 domain-containing protein [unclassified Dysgonomonas]MDH6354109.1 hypothetical protein [Dysgonomonas sp. PH5-45]MDH6387040.1 hypothetical protein [Dysgonomonas sp. PH5-37]